MSATQPNPGGQYIVRERLGKGRWKEVYRAVVRGGWHDRALARFIEEPGGRELFDEIKTMLDSKAQGVLQNVARVYSVFKGEDDQLYIEEELLYRPLEALAPLKMLDKFFRIGRDLCTGLASLHGRDWVHRDLKLDNCGIDHSGTAKIFDLGALTSEGGSVKGTTLSRAPEIFGKDAKCTKPSDVWAMGAVLFALRTGGDYPFVTKEEARNRPLAGRDRELFDQMVQTRSSDPRSEQALFARIAEEFPNGSAKLMSQMLAFAPASRPTAQECAERWDGLLKPWIPQQAQDIDAKERDYQDIVAFLNAVLSGSAGMSSLQWERVSKAIDELEAKLDVEKKSNLTEIRRRVADMREREAVGA